MKYKKIRLKIRDLITILLMQLVLTLPFYSASVYGLTISNVKVTKVTSSSATIEWTTDAIANGKVRYGKTAVLGFTQRHDNFIDNHTIAVFNGIEPDATYFFAVESTDLAGNTAADNNSNNFYTFKTADITPPPKVLGLKVVSTTSDSVALSWTNAGIADLRHYLIYRDRVAVANSTTNSFNNTNLSSNKAFSYKVSAVDLSGNEGAQSDTVIASTLAIDSSSPVISDVEVLPLTDTTARVTWLTNENSTSIVLYGINKTDKVKSSEQLVTNHSIVIDSLVKNIKHIFIVKSCDASANCVNSSREGVPEGFVAGKDTTPPSLNFTIPRFFNRRFIDITGSTEQFASVTLFVNNMNLPKRSLSSKEIGSSGKFAFSQIQLEQDNIIKLVAVDKSGNKNEKTAEISIDSEDPAVQLNELPAITSITNISVSGTVTEPVKIKVFIDSKINISATENVPLKIEGLNATKIGQNFIELHWNESKDKDFSHYVVYRDNVPIATTKPANFNLYIDALVDSGKTYNYRVSAVNTFAKESELSDALSVKTEAGGKILNLNPPKVDILEDFRKPVMIVDVNTSGKFDFLVLLNKGDGAYSFKFDFEDRAGNSVVIQKNVVLDTKKPEIKVTSPPSGALIFENLADAIDIIGKTEPNARVNLFVNKMPFGFNDSFDAKELEERFKSLPLPKFDKCQPNEQCPKIEDVPGADFSTTADSEGNFKFDKIDLTARFGGVARLREVSLAEFKDVQLNEEAKESRKATIVVIAGDQAGLRNFVKQEVRLGTCWVGNQSWETTPLSQYQSPTLLSTERLGEGTETIYFYLKYSYRGLGQNPKIKSVSMTKACGTKEVLDPRFNISCAILSSLPSPKLLNVQDKDNTVSYQAVPLSKFPGMDKFLDSDWKNFQKAINTELTFPFKVSIQYEHEVVDENGETRTVRETQTTCEQVSYVVDSTLIDPRKILPDWLLYDFVDFLQGSIKTLTDVQDTIDKLIDYVAVGCLASYFANVAVKVWRSWMEFSDENNIFRKKEIIFKFDIEQQNQECKEITEAVKKAYGGLKLKYFSDADLKKCFPRSASAWETEAKIYQLQRWSCDRIFGHSAPSKWTETEGDDDLHKKITSAKTCASDGDARGRPLGAARKCRDIIESSFPQLKRDIDAFKIDDKCLVISERDKKTLFKVGRQIQDNLYEIEKIEGPVEILTRYVVKVGENYMTKQPQTCAELCGAQPAGQANKITSNGKVYELRSSTAPARRDEVKKVLSGCVTVSECREWHEVARANKGQIRLGNGEILNGYTVDRKGYTSDCFYDGSDTSVVSPTDSNLRRECCCVAGTSSKPTGEFYHPEDKYPRLEKTKFADNPVHESKSKPSEPPQKIGDDIYSDMKWSYRYSRIKFEAKGKDGTIHSNYNPNRYIEGRDLPACFGQNNLFYQWLGKEKEVVVVDPFKQHSASLQCLYLTGVNQRLQMMKNIMAAMSNCLVSVRKTGGADSGACKELFTMHVCNLIWQGIRWFVDGCTPEDVVVDAGDREERFTDTLRFGLKGITQGISEATRELTDEYGNAKLNNLLGFGEETVARKICLAAFGYDWDINARNFVDAAYAAPFATLVQGITRSREYLNVDPVSFKAKYEYRASWLINPGCDLESYDVQLACVTRKEVDEYPNAVNCGAVGAPSIQYTVPLGTSTAYNNCDCLEQKQEQTTSFFSESRVKQNSLVDRNQRKVIESDRRYDHIKITLRPDRRIPPELRAKCFPNGYEKGVFYFPIIDKSAKDIADCQADVTSGLFICGGGLPFVSKKGIARFVEFTINNEEASKVKELPIGKELLVGIKLTNTGKDKCIRVSLSSDIKRPEYVGVVGQGFVEIPPFTVTPSLSVFGRTGNIDARGIVFDPVAQENEFTVPINIKATDNIDKTKPDYQKGNEQKFTLDDELYIDGIRIDMSKDYRDKIQGDQTTQVRVNVVGEKPVERPVITIEKQGAIIKIRDISYTPVQVGDKEFIHRYSDDIRINPPQPGTQASQQKTLLIELFHIKEDAEEYGSNPETCNLNDKITERRFTFTVSQLRGSDVGRQNPAIVPKEPSKRTYKAGEDVPIVVTITHQSGIEEVKLLVKGPDGSIVDNENMAQMLNTYDYRYIIGGNLLQKGTYEGTITAKSNAGTTSKRTFIFEITQ
ncbi:fibronectin type III domain-containing protein [Candidatus Woesearchaeota archaeon]|nr:fibronectin type III domain-containing protein [Candidatus Woesearchaeota archaeon]